MMAVVLWWPTRARARRLALAWVCWAWKSASGSAAASSRSNPSSAKAPRCARVYPSGRETRTVTKPLRVLLADDHVLVRAGIRALLDKLSAVSVVAEASDGREALSLIETQRPNVVIIDVAMPGLNGLEATARIHQQFPQVRVIILSMHANE